MYNHNLTHVYGIREKLTSLFNVDDCLMFSPYKYKTDEVYAPLQAGFNIEDDGEPKKYLGT